MSKRIPSISATLLQSPLIIRITSCESNSTSKLKNPLCRQKPNSSRIASASAASAVPHQPIFRPPAHKSSPPSARITQPTPPLFICASQAPSQLALTTPDGGFYQVLLRALGLSGGLGSSLMGILVFNRASLYSLTCRSQHLTNSKGSKGYFSNTTAFLLFQILHKPKATIWRISSI
ncbi:hypothetical protein PRUPE_6G162700 [Prunus persica]|uniref:Uncharacterized protein n=1 Tax=Prunus persica TaxID=3760 RepID=A0A251NRB3_PRUPE|nr:hypothetical protein PRUPE_6G162700 [Prunus persica]